MADSVHVLPADDLVEHELGPRCACGPRDEPVVRQDGSIGWVTVHHSLDGRERNET